MSIPIPPAPDDKSSEPALKVGAIVSVATAAVGAAIVFGADKERAESLLALVAAIAAAVPLLTALWARRKVFSPKTVAELLRRERTR
jgi:hypothetical protein